MIISRGEVELDGAVILKGVTFRIDQTPSSEQGQGYWSGSFRIPPNGGDGALAIYQASDPATLTLEDGRSGQFNYAGDSGRGMVPGETMRIKGTGPLK
jgi:hypothetical protein